jgi:hypothetical protein
MNMMGLSSMPHPDFGHTDMNRVLNLIAVLASPEASKAMLEQLGAARDQAQAKIDEAVTQGAAIAVAEREHNEKITRERKQHANALATAQTTFDQECAARLTKLQSSERDAHGVKREAVKLLEEAKAKHADLDRRLEKIRAATA